MPAQPKDVADRLSALSAGFGERVNKAALKVGNRAEAAQVMGLSDDQLNRIIREKAVPTFSAMAGLARASGYSLEWLAFDDNRIVPVGGSGERMTALVAANVDKLPADTVMVRRYDVRFAAGAGETAAEGAVVGTLPFSRHYLEHVLRCDVEDVAIGEAVGDSMENTISSGDLLLVHLKRRKIADGQIFVLRLGDELVVKRVQRELDGSLLLLSDNKAYADRRLTQAEADQVDVIGRLIWSGGAV